MGGFSIWHWIILIVIVVLLFGGKGKLRNLGEDLSAGIKSFKKGLQEPEDAAKLKADPPAQGESAPPHSDKVDSRQS